MDTDRWHRIQRLFAEALAVSVAERASWLQQACGDDAELLHEVQALLAHDAASQRTLEQVVRSEADAVLAQVKVQRQGERFGPWEIVEHIADGGMGAVYRARRADGAFEQVAALKLLSPALLGEQGRRRLEVERQILAGLNHPHIARLLDGGSSAEGVPYLVMEYVDGVPIDDYCNTQGLDTPARLRLFLRVCEAVDYAHRNLVVHRDLKPSNLLVTADGTPKLLDFGISKLLDAADPALTAADQRLFTPAHASPEQVSGGPITTATDVYALGVLLYELLAGSLPFAAAGRTSAQIAQDILQTEPARPSVSVARTADSSERLAAARRRGDGLTAERLRRELDGDLDNIVLMALRKEPVRRYASVQALAEDVRAMLEHRPVKARADTLTYRTAKFLKRRRWAVIAASAATVAVLGQSVYYVQRLQAERDAAELARSRAEQVAAFLQDLLQGADRFATAGKKVELRDILDRGAERIRAQLADQPLEQARLLETIAQSYNGLGLYEAQLRMAQRVHELRLTVLGPTDADTLASLRGVGVAVSNVGDHKKGADILESALTQQRVHLAPNSPEIAVTLHELGNAKRALGFPAAALADQRAALEILSAQLHFRANTRYLPAVMNQIGNALDGMDERRAAIEAYREALALYEQYGQADHPAVGAVLHNIGLSLDRMGQPAEALPYLERAVAHTRRVLGEDNPEFETQAGTLGQTYASLGRFDEAEKYVRLALEKAEKLYGTEHQFYAYNLSNLATVLQLEGRHADALQVLNEATRIYRGAFGDYHRFLAAAETKLASAMIEVGKPAEAAALTADLLKRMQTDPEHERRLEAAARSVLGHALGRIGRDAEARELLTTALRDLRQQLGGDHPLTVTAARYLTEFRERRGEVQAAADARKLGAPTTVPAGDRRSGQ
jgi:eukaryotic-like serine/threonine-protein kinase